MHASVGFFQNSIHNLAQAVQSRVFMRKTNEGWCYIDETLPPSDIYRNNDYGFKDSFLENVEPLAPMTQDEFLGHYVGRRRRVYEKAIKSLELYPLEISDAHCKCFLKKEKDIRSLKPDAIPRVITFPDPRYGSEFGRFVKSIEKPFFKCIDGCFVKLGMEPVVAKGLNYLEVGQMIEKKWNKFVNPCSIDGDVSRLDSSITNDAQRMYHNLVQSFFYEQDLDEWFDLCSMQLDVPVTGKARNGGISYLSSGLGSGQMNTSQMGVFVVCYILHALIVKERLVLELVNCGDDFTIIGEECDVRRFQKLAPQFFSTFNMVLKMEPIVHEIELIVFCQTQPVYVDGCYRMVRDPRTAMVKDSTSIDNLDNITKRVKHLHAISCSGIATHGGIPIFQDFYKSLARNSQFLRTFIKSKRGSKRSYHTSLKDCSMTYWGRNLVTRYNDQITDKTRFSFYLAFDIDPVEQLYIENYYKTYNISDVVITDNETLEEGDRIME